MAFFYLLAFFFYIKASEHRDAGTLRRLYLSGAVASFLLAIGSKETAVTLPLILLLWDLLIRRLRGPVSPRRGPLLPSSVLDHSALRRRMGLEPSPLYRSRGIQFQLRPFWDNLLSEAHAITYALLLFFRPWKQNFDHDLPEFHSLFQWPLPARSVAALWQ